MNSINFQARMLRAENAEDRKVIPFEPLRVQQIRERLKELDDAAIKVIDERFKLENELEWLGYHRD